MSKKEWKKPRWKTVRPGDIVVRWVEYMLATGTVIGLVVGVTERNQAYHAAVVWGEGGGSSFSELPTTKLMKVSSGE